MTDLKRLSDAVLFIRWRGLASHDLPDFVKIEREVVEREITARILRKGFAVVARIDETLIDAIAASVSLTLARHRKTDPLLAGEITRAVLETLELHSVPNEGAAKQNSP